MENVPQSRRKFITTLTLLLASGGLLVRYLKPLTPARRRVLVSVAAADVPLNGALVFQNERLAVMKDNNGVYALSLVCTHLGCTVTVTENSFSCPCHGSLFNRQGKVERGPANGPLGRLHVVTENGMIQVLGA